MVHIAPYDAILRDLLRPKATTFRVVTNRLVAFGEPWLHSLQNAKASFAFHSFAQAFNHTLRHLT